MKELKIINKNIEDIKEYENNAKEHPDWQIEQIANSIQEFGFNDPIAINTDNQIIEGHGRLLAAKQLGLSEVPCIVLDGLTEVQERAYIIAHNKTTMNTDFDLDRLQYELNALKVEDFDLSLTGFSDDEIDRLLNKLDDIEENQEELNNFLFSKEALFCPVDIWHDLSIYRSIFMSDRLRLALFNSKLKRDISLLSCNLTSN